MTASSTTTAKPATAAAQSKRLDYGWLIFCAIPTLAVVCINIVWFLCDHSWPCWDAAHHISNGIVYGYFFRIPDQWSLEKLYALINLEHYYPPFVYVVNGAIKALLGNQYWTDVVVSLSFMALLCISIYRTGMILFQNRFAAGMSILLINAYPLNLSMGHAAMLDYPLMAMVSCALWRLVLWTKKPGWKSSVATGAVMGLALMTKQTGVVFLAPPCAALLLFFLISRRFRQAVMLTVSGGITALITLPWFLANSGFLEQFAHEHGSVLNHSAMQSGFLENLSFYASYLYPSLSPLLFAAFLTALLTAGLTAHRRMIILNLSALSGIVLLSLVDWLPPQVRYIMPATIVPALYTGYAMSGLWNRRSQKVRAVIICAGVLVSIQSIFLSFTPYPVAVPGWLSCAERNIFRLKEGRSGEFARYIHPSPLADWGILWTLLAICEREGGHTVDLNVLPNSPNLNEATLKYAALSYELPVRVGSSRRWTPVGDELEFSKKEARRWDWYLVKSGDQGVRFHPDTSDEKNYERLEEFIRTGHQFELHAARQLPDGETLMLYRRIRGESR